jgi:CubicO group peptidase (beta-lactamase class C family)
VLPTTPFIIGSLTKSFTAMAILQLVDQGLIDIDQPVQNYIPWFEIADEGESGKITVRHLLNQISGFSSFDGRTRFTDSDVSANALEARVRELKSLNLTAPVGEKFIYSNINYDVLGLIVQMVSGMHYEDYIEQNIFTPLNMTNSYTDKETAIKNNLAVGYNYFAGKPFAAVDVPYPRKLIASGFLVTSGLDLGNYMIAQLNEGRFENSQLLSNDSMSNYHAPQKGSYAMGWFSQGINNKEIITHDGLVSNYKASVGLLPSEGWGVALLVNGQDMIFDGAARDLSLNVMRIMAGEEVVPETYSLTEIVFYLIVVILVLQLVGIRRTFLLIKNWQINFPPLNWKSYSRYIVLPFILSLLLALSIFFVIPLLELIPWSGLLLFAPDAWIFVISGSIALVWGAGRAVLLTSVLLHNKN